MGCGASQESSPGAGDEIVPGSIPLPPAVQDEGDQVEESEPAAEPYKPPPAAMRKRKSVSAECYTPGQAGQVSTPVVKKTDEQSTSIRALMSDNILFKTLDKEQTQTLVDAFVAKSFTAGETIITQGDFVAVHTHTTSDTLVSRKFLLFDKQENITIHSNKVQ